MQKLYRNIFAAGVISLGLAACGDDVTVTPPASPPAPGVTSVTVAPGNQTINVGQTVEFQASVAADAGVSDLSVVWSSSNTAIATVSAGTNGGEKVLGVAAGTTTIVAKSNANTGVIGVATVTVVGLPPGVTSFNANPPSLSLLVGGTATGNITATYATGVTAPTITWTSLNPSVASVVPATGVITANAPGVATVRASATVSGLPVSADIIVTVGAAPSISISSVTTGNLATPVNVSNVAGQIEVNLNFNPRDLPIAEVDVWIDQAGVPVIAAKQVFGGAIPAAGMLTLSINTANYQFDVPAVGSAKASFLNGQTTVRASIVRAGAASVPPVDANCGVAPNSPICATPIAMVLNNIDAWAAKITLPTRPAVIGVGGSSVGQPFVGGPGATGVLTATLYPVIYTPNRTISTTTLPTWGVTGCTAAQATGVRTFGATGSGSQNACAYENTTTIRDNVKVVAALDNLGLTYPTGLIANNVVFASTPDSLREDWLGPASITVPNALGSEGFSWVNDAWAFNQSATVGDNGVGANTTSWQAFLAPGFTVAVVNSATLPETNTNVSPDASQLRASATDLLGNSANSGLSVLFGVDRTVPTLRYSSAASPSLFASIHVAGGATAVTDSSTRTFTSLTNSSVLQAVPAAGTFDSVRTEAIDNRSGLSRAILTSRRFGQGGATGATTNLTACSSGASGDPVVGGTSSNAFGVALLDGFRPAPQQHIFCGAVVPGYYTSTQTAVDRAGNRSVTYKRTVAYDPGQPAVTGVSPNLAYTGNLSQNFSIGTQDDLEGIDSKFRMHYPNLTQGDIAGPFTGVAATSLIWNFGALVNSAFGTRFDASIINPQVSTLAGDLFTVSIQETCLATGTPAGCLYRGDPIAPGTFALAKPDSVAVTIRDVFGSFVPNTAPGAANGVSSEFPSSILSATVPAVGNYTVSYDATANCPAGGVVGGNCITTSATTAVNFRLFAPQVGTTYTFRSTESRSNSLPNFTRVDLFQLIGGQWVFVSRCTWAAGSIVPGGTTACGTNMTVTGSDSGFERYWDFTFTNLTGATQYRALGVNSSGFGLFSTRSIP